MRIFRLFLGSTLLLFLGFVAAPLSASAAPATSYDGVFAGSIAYDKCAPNPGHDVTSGTWSVTLHGASAKATFDIYVNGAPHVAYTYPGMKTAAVSGTVFTAYGATQAGPLTITLFDDGDFTYVIAPYSYDGLTCQRVTYSGTVST